MGLDIVLTGSQKAFGVPPGMAMIWAGPRALQRRESLGEIPEYYCDFQLWLPVIHNPAKYFATPAVNMVWALKEGVRIMLEEGWRTAMPATKRTPWHAKRFGSSRVLRFWPMRNAAP